jgi:S1-C subfamily serine protease
MRLKMVISLVTELALSPLWGQTPAPAKSKAAPLAAFSQSLESLAARVGPAVVQIVSTGYGRGDAAQQGASSLLARQRSTGSGVILSDDGFIVTNYHVVQGARRIEVRLAVDESAGWHGPANRRGSDQNRADSAAAPELWQPQGRARGASRDGFRKPIGIGRLGKHGGGQFNGAASA